ncbi:MAG: SAM hydrolase/SAM-dependent halogenase family protein [Steroidobacteraceae bacterium]
MSERASGVITLTSDFGLRDPFVGVMKGRILARHPGAHIVDLTHDIVAHWPAEAGFWLARSFDYFPSGSVHVAVVDPGVGTARDILVVEARGHVFLAPDNGLLAPVLTRDPQAIARRIDSAPLVSLGIARPSATFHGRDIFAPLAAELARGAIQAATLGPVTAQIVPSWVDEPQRSMDRVSGMVITVDHFGNLLTNIDRSFLEGIVDPLVVAGHLSVPLRRTYGDVRPGEPIALVNSFDVVEIAVAEGRAAEVLGLSRGAPVTVRDAVRRA